MARYGGEAGGAQKAVFLLQGQLLGHVPFCGGDYRGEAAKSAHVAEVLYTLSPRAEAEQADEGGGGGGGGKL